MPTCAATNWTKLDNTLEQMLDWRAVAGVSADDVSLLPSIADMPFNVVSNIVRIDR